MTLVDRFLHRRRPDSSEAGGARPALGVSPRLARGLLVALGVILVLALAIFLVLSRTDWNFARGPLSRFASARLGRAVRLDGDLRAHLLSFTPEVDAGGLKIANPAWVGAGDVVDAGEFRVKVELMPLLLGHVNLPLVELDGLRLDLLRDVNGRENWALSPQGSGRPLRLPPIREFLIADGRLHLVDQTRKMAFDGSVEASERPEAAGGRGFHLSGQGRLNDEIFQLQASGGPLIAVRRDRPYPFRMDVRDGPTQAVVKAVIDKPFDLGAVDGSLDISGPDLAKLYDLTGVTFPNTPAYRLSARFERRASRYSFTGVYGTVGTSDLEGRLAVDRIKGRRTVDADLTSQRLTFPDLLAVIGGPPHRAAATAPIPVAATSARPPRSQPPPAPVKTGPRVLPDAPLYKSRLQTMDANVRYTARSIRGGPFSLARGAVAIKLDHGVMTLQPLSLDFAQGRLGGQIRIDARGKLAKTSLDLRLTGLGLQELIKSASAEPPVDGALEARARLEGEGDSVHAAAAAANGEVVFVVPHGQMRQAFAELMGINVGRGLYLLLSKSPKQTDLRCGVAQFDVRNGIMQAQTLVIDTGVVTAVGSGTINLGTETLDLKLKGHTKHPELLRVWSPILVKGSFSKPSLGVDVGSVAAQGGLAAGVTALLGPLTAILPFIAPGMAKNADCAGLIAEAKAAGAPVKVPPQPVKTSAPATAAPH